MKYRLYDNGTNDTSNILKEVLNNRGIPDYNTYMNLDESVEIPYSKLKNIEMAVTLFNSHYEKKDKIAILVDEDVDGFTSASAMFNYIKKLDEQYPLEYILHTRAKAHGLSEDVVIPDGTKLLIIPDAASNDVDKCTELSKKGVDILILDHHEMEKTNHYAVIVNNQISDDYSNKNLSGVGVVYKFLQALDSFYWVENADAFLDLVALGLIGDVMDIRSYETKYLINKGIKQIENKAFSALIKAQKYSMNGTSNIHNIQWYIVPIINAMVRIGKQEEKELLFRAFIEQDETFEYNKRAIKGNLSEVIEESIYDRAARLSKNTKARQDKIKEKGVQTLVAKIEADCSNDKVIIVDGTDDIENGLTGVIAIKIAEMFRKPCVLLNKHISKKIVLNSKTQKLEVEETIVFGGSSRNFNNSPILNFKDVVNSTEVFDFALGHQSAFGIQLQSDRVDVAKETLNNILKDVVYESTYLVDYILPYSEFSIQMINEISKLQDVIGQGIDEVKIALENIALHRDDFKIIGAKGNTVKFQIQDNIECIQFNCKDGNELFDWLNSSWDDNDSISFSIVGTPSFNEFNGVKTPQFVISGLQVISKSKDTEIEDDEDIW